MKAAISMWRNSPRTFYYEPQMQRIDYIVLVLLGIVLVGLLFMRLGLGLGAIMPGRL